MSLLSDVLPLPQRCLPYLEPAFAQAIPPLLVSLAALVMHCIVKWSIFTTIAQGTAGIALALFAFSALHPVYDDGLAKLSFSRACVAWQKQHPFLYLILKVFLLALVCFASSLSFCAGSILGLWCGITLLWTQNRHWFNPYCIGVS